MRRRLLTILLLLLAGAVVNVGVAWTCSLLVVPSGGSKRNGFLESTGFGYTTQSALVTQRRPAVQIQITPGFPPETLEEAVEYEEAFPVRAFAGWPARCFVIDTTQLWLGKEIAYSELAPAGFPVLSEVSSGTDVPPIVRRVITPVDERRLPTQILWPGAVVNTLLYTTLLWVLFLTSFTLRRLIRARRGLCPACGYPVGESAVCSECGKAVRSRRSATT